MKQRAEAERQARLLMQAFVDLDQLLGCDSGFLLGSWIAAARFWQNASDAPAVYYEWQAKSQISTWWPVPASALNDSSTYTGIPPLDSYASKHWNGLVRDFYAPRLQCYVAQMLADFPSSKAPTCIFGPRVNNTFLSGFPRSLSPTGQTPPISWPYNASDLGAAQAWCCDRIDCGGITWDPQSHAFQARSGRSANACSYPSYSYPRVDHIANISNLTHCVVVAEMAFIHDTGTVYADRATPELTLTLSKTLVQRYNDMNHSITREPKA